MAGPTFNTVTLRDDEYLKDATKSVLNMMLGAEGKPKYTQADLALIKRTALLEEITPLYEARATENPKAPKEKKTLGAPPKASKNKKSAQSKKCHLLKALALGTKTWEQALHIYDDDFQLRQICTLEELKFVLENKTRPGAKRRSVTVELKPGESMDNSNYIVAWGQGEGPDAK